MEKITQRIAAERIVELYGYRATDKASKVSEVLEILKKIAVKKS